MPNRYAIGKAPFTIEIPRFKKRTSENRNPADREMSQKRRKNIITLVTKTS